MNEETNTPEPLAAIIAEMRYRADNHRQDGWESVGEELDDLADRIEAAAERERASLEDALSHCREFATKIERENEEGETRLDAEEIIATVDNEFAGIRPKSTPGNAAAMREALDKAECVLLVAARFATDNAFTDAEARENLRDVDWDGALTEIDAALAAPARNCDILSEEAANKAWDDYRHANVLPRGGWDFRHIIAWLFAPAEGGAE